MKPRKLKLFGFSTWLRDLPDKHRGSNGDRTKYCLCRCATKKRLLEITGASPPYFSTHGMCYDRSGTPELEAVALLPERIYYQPEHTKNGFIKGWFLLDEPDKPVNVKS